MVENGRWWRSLCTWDPTNLCDLSIRSKWDPGAGFLWTGLSLTKGSLRAARAGPRGGAVILPLELAL